jgi:hypothetical protein
VVCLLLLPSAQPTWLEAAGDFLFVNNFTGRGINGVTWSLSWETQYYLVAPFVFLCFGKPTPRALAIVLALAILFEIMAMLDIRKYPPTEFMFYFLLGFALNLLLRRTGLRKFAGSSLLAVGGGFFLGNGLYYLLFNADLELIANPWSAWRRRCPSSCSSCRAPTSVRRCRSKGTPPFGCSCSESGPGSASSPTGSISGTCRCCPCSTGWRLMARRRCSRPSAGSARAGGARSCSI